MSNIDFPLADAIEELRDELLKAQVSGADNSMRFIVDEIDVELQLVASSKVEGRAKIGWKVLGANVGGDISNSITHRLKLKLKLPANEDGSPRRISGEDVPPHRE